MLGDLTSLGGDAFCYSYVRSVRNIVISTFTPPAYYKVTGPAGQLADLAHTGTATCVLGLLLSWCTLPTLLIRHCLVIAWSLPRHCLAALLLTALLLALPCYCRVTASLLPRLLNRYCLVTAALRLPRYCVLLIVPRYGFGYCFVTASLLLPRCRLVTASFFRCSNDFMQALDMNEDASLLPRLLPRHCLGAASLLLPSLLPRHCFVTASLLPRYCLVAASLLPRYGLVIASLLTPASLPPSYSLFTASRLPRYCIVIAASLLPRYCLVMSSPLPCCSVLFGSPLPRWEGHLIRSRTCRVAK